MEGINITAVSVEDMQEMPVKLLCPCGCNATVKGEWLRLDLNLKDFYSPFTCPISNKTFVVRASELKRIKP